MQTQLNQQFAHIDRLQFVEGKGGMTVAEMNSRRASASVALHGGHVLAFQPKGFEPVLWLSEHAVYKPGKAIRGGIPVCWPWFGPHPIDVGKPSHGFARISQWTVFSSRVINEEDVQLHLKLTDDALTRSLWPHAFEATVRITLSDQLHVDLIIQNNSKEAFTFTGALHTYLNVSNIDQIAIQGLDGCEYIDQLVDGPLKSQNGSIRFTQETDNIYVDTSATCILDDGGLSRRIIVEKSGSESTVIWNPWIDKAARMTDFGNDEYQRMVCIETANAAHNSVEIPPGSAHEMSTTIRVERSS